jgi:hypothetical protein
MLQWLVSQNCDLDINLYYYAAVYGKIDILMWLYSHHLLMFSHQTKCSIMKCAARNGHVHIMKWLNSLDPCCKWNRGITNAAAQAMEIYALKWLLSQEDPPFPWNERELYKLASSTGNIMLMKCLRHFNPSYPWHHIFCANAAKNGHLRILRWLRCQDPPCPINLNQCIALAAEQEHIEVVDWLRIQTEIRCANCSREECRCKNRGIELPMNYEQDRKEIIYCRNLCDEDPSIDSDNSSTSSTDYEYDFVVGDIDDD